MARCKVRLSYISNDSTRRTTFVKRKRGLLKKARELSTLCGVDTCAIIYSPSGGEPDVWPSQAQTNVVLQRFMSMPEMEQSKKKVNQEEFLRERIGKASEQYWKLKKNNYDSLMTHVMFQLLSGEISSSNMNVTELNDLKRIIKQNLNEVQMKIKTLENNASASQISQAIVPA